MGGGRLDRITSRESVDPDLLAAMEANGWALTGTVQAMLADGWWPSQILEWFEWGSRPATSRPMATARTVIEADDDRYEFIVDDDRLRAPYPPELGFPAQAGQLPPFVAPGERRTWLKPLQPRPGTPIDSWGVAQIEGERETLNSMQGIGQFCTDPFAGSGWPQWGATVSVASGVVAVGCRFKDQRGDGKERPGSAEMTWYIPAVSVAKVEVSTSFQLGRPRPVGRARREARTQFDRRGYGPLTAGWVTITYSDGWRLCRVSLGGDIAGQSEESFFLRMVDGVLGTVATAQRRPMSKGITVPGSDDSDVFRFPDAVHWGIPLQRVDSSPRTSAPRRTLGRS